jgi:FkbM family methyltransferase
MEKFQLKKNSVSESKRRAVELLLKSGGPLKFVLGRNKYAASVARVINVEAFVDDYTIEKTFLGRPIIRTSDLPADSVCVSCVVDGRPVTALNRLKSSNVRVAVDYFTLFKLKPELFEQVSFCDDNQADIENNYENYQWVFDKLADEASRNIFTKVVLFRYTFDLEYMTGMALKINEQYFEEFLELNDKEVFVDGGGFDGSTSLYFFSKVNKCKQVYYFEPSPEMMAVSRQRLSHLKNITYIQKGLSNKCEKLRFDAEAGSTSRISITGKQEIETTFLDREILEPISFIKLDIEGAEFDAIDGAADHIRRHAPKIAVCVYHHQADFWRIARRILEYNSSYKIYLRHYSEGILETVMFFVPKNT